MHFRVFFGRVTKEGELTCPESSRVDSTEWTRERERMTRMMSCIRQPVACPELYGSWLELYGSWLVATCMRTSDQSDRP